MDPQADSDEEFIVLSTSDYTESASYVLFVSAVVLSLNFMPLEISQRPGRRAQKQCQSLRQIDRTSAFLAGSEETMGRQIADHRSVTNYTYIINGGRGGSGGEGGDQGGYGGAGHGPTVNFSQPQAREELGFQTIRLEDINLMKTIRLDPHSDVVGCRSRGVGVRRIYHAEIRRNPGTVTVMMYQGEGAEEEWRHHVAKYESIRHPNIMQLYGLVSTKNLYAMVFHDELIPYRQFLDRFEHSPILTVYIAGYCLIGKNTEFKEATNYISGVFPKSSDSDNLSIWIRPSKGELCLDLVQGGAKPSSELPVLADPAADIVRLENMTLDAPDSEDILISSLSDDQYHELCSRYPVAWFQRFQVSAQHPVGPGIFRSDSHHGTCMRLTELPVLPTEFRRNWTQDEAGELLPNSWIRYDSRRIRTITLELRLSFGPYEAQKAWLAQANHIFAKLQEREHVENYVCICNVRFILQCVPIANKLDIDPQGYLFVCPPGDFRTDNKAHANLYQWPVCPAYWSLNLSGADHLSTEDARMLGFPAIHIETVVDGLSWHRSVYEGLRRFHEGKGFDPESREVARRLGYPLYEVLRDRVPFPAREVDPLWPYSCKQDDPALCRWLGHYL
ncbi:hypothetical protein MSAN_01509300 [Mycena sanguinolenta]|uniref:Protein kinase domain-containing protein n=1 Tax=Mycena sanguinolenta TaxID=230812 RepID=A0A8H7CZ32_9AGAR|nr:hypothetical protein MSAN_01509300 [Mycena sanguinolenta]